MNLPSSGEQRDKLADAFLHLKHNVYFEEVTKWFREQLALRDEENRIPGCENKYSEAQALAKILDQVDAE